MQYAVAAGFGVGLTRSLLAVAAQKVAIPVGPFVVHPMTYHLFIGAMPRGAKTSVRKRGQVKKLKRVVRPFMHA